MSFQGSVWQNTYFSALNIPPVGASCSNLNFGRARSCSGDEERGREKFVVEKLALADLGGVGQSVMSVIWVTEWNLAKDITVEALEGPEWMRISGRAVLICEEGSFWMVM